MAAAMDLENNWLNGSFGVKSRFIVVQELISVVAWWLDEGGWVGGMAIQACCSKENLSAGQSM